MKPYNCKCRFESQVSELKAQKKELLEALTNLIHDTEDKQVSMRSFDDAWKNAKELIQKYKSNE